MDNYIVRQPILNRKNETVAYEILYQQDASSLFQNEKDIPAANAIEEFIAQGDSDKIAAGKVAWLTFTPGLLLRNIPTMFTPEKLVIQIEDNSLVHPLAQKVIYRYQKKGYELALKGFEFSPRYFSVLDAISKIKLDFTAADEEKESYANIASIGKSFQKQIVAYNVNTREDYELAEKIGCDLFQGTYIATPRSERVRRVDHMQSNFFQLIVAITKDEPDVDEIAEIISRDVTLAFALIKLVNSAYFALRNRAKSVKQALLVLGLGQLKQWVYLLSFKQDGSDAPEELIRISFLRGNFAQALSRYVEELPISQSEAYMMGMFSTLGVLMDISLEDALSELAISDDVKKALLYGEGKAGQLFQMVLCYENADWSGITHYARALGIPVNIISQKYFECVEYVNNIWQSLSQPYETEEKPTEMMEKAVREGDESDSD